MRAAAWPAALMAILVSARVTPDSRPGQDQVGCSNPVLSGDELYVRSLSSLAGGGYLSIDQDRVVAADELGHPGVRARFRLETDMLSGPVHTGHTVFLRSAHSGFHIDVRSAQESAARARWRDHGQFQSLMLFKDQRHDDTTLAVCYGDTIYLRAHTRAFLDVEGDLVRARWGNRGDYQRFVLEHAHEHLQRDSL